MDDMDLFEKFGSQLNFATEDILRFAVLGLATVISALLVHAIVFRLLARLTGKSQSPSDDLVVRKLASPTRYTMVALALGAAASHANALSAMWEGIAAFVMPALLGWIAVSLVRGLVAAMELRTAPAIADDMKTRRQHTRLRIFSRLATALIIFITAGLMLFAIPGVREIGITLMASAGLAALAVGAAAQPALKSLIAGLQMALTEPIRIGDLVVVDGHTGRVKEIRMTYVLVRIWDERLLVVPTARFFDSSFENWSRHSEKLTGAVHLHLDPATVVEPIRTEFLRFIATQELWDGRSAILLVTHARAETIELRLAMSAKTIRGLWDLRCAVREHMLDWLRREQPAALIRRRLEVAGADQRASGNMGRESG